MRCAKCNAELPDESQFCLKCGNAQKVKPTTKSPLKSLGYVGIGIVVAALGFYAWQLTRSHSSAGQEQFLKRLAAPQQSQLPAAKPYVPRVLSAQEIFHQANGSMALIETFDNEGHGLEQGSGFVVSADGTTVTNYHVIRGASRAIAKFGDGTSSEVDGVLAFDRARDVAVLKLSAPARTPLHLGDSGKVEVGEKIVAIGSPLGLENTLSEGIVSGMRNGVIQMSSPISPGSSGGAVFDRYGNVIGISVATVAAGQNLNFAVPINWAKAYLNGEDPQTFADVISENSITNDLLNSPISVQANQYKAWTLVVNPNVMNSVEIDGQITSSGGMGGQISLSVVRQGQTQPIYSCRSTNCTIDQKLVAPGTYIVVLDNRNSPLFSRTVTGNISEKYVQ